MRRMSSPTESKGSAPVWDEQSMAHTKPSGTYWPRQAGTREGAEEKKQVCSSISDAFAVPKLKTPLPSGSVSRSPWSPVSPLSPTRRAMDSFGLAPSELKGVGTNTEGELEIDGIPEEHWDIRYSDLVIEKELAEGTFGRVYQGSYFGTAVAVKLLFQADVVANIGKYILRELAMLRAVTHPNIVQFLGLCRHGQDVFVVTEYVPRGDLMEVLHSPDVAPISWSLAVHLMTEITKPLAFLHSRRVIHRDIKLENVLVGQNWSIKLCDFGFARCMDNVDVRPAANDEDARHHRMRRMTVAGTDQWMAPEVLLQQPYNEQADVFSLGCTFYELVCRKQPPSRTIVTKYAFDVQEFLYEVPKQAPKEIVVLILDMCQLVPHQRPSAKVVLQRLSDIQVALPPVDLSEGSDMHRRLKQQMEQMTATPKASHRGLAHDKSVPESADSLSSSDDPDSSNEQDSTAGDAETNMLALQLRRALSADSASGFKDLGPGADLMSSFDAGSKGSLVSPLMRFHSVTGKSCAGNAVAASWLVITSSVRPKARKYYCALLTDGMMHFWKSEKQSEFSCMRILLEQNSAVQRGDKAETLRLSSPVHPGVFWLLDCKTAAAADKWYNAALGVIMRSDVNYLNRLKSGAHFGWTAATRGEDGSCFLVQMVKPDSQTVALYVSPQVLRIVRPFTEEILAEWSFSQLSGYTLSPGGHIGIAVARTRLGEPSSAYSGSSGNSASGNVLEYAFSSSLHKQIYEVLEAAWLVSKEKHDGLYKELLAGAVQSPATIKLKARRISLGFSAPRPVLEGQQPPPAASPQGSPLVDKDRPRAGTLGSLFQRKKEDAAAKK